MKKLLLIQSTPYAPNRTLIKKNKLYFVGLGLPLLAALTPPDWEVQIVLETIEDIPFDTDADLIAIGSMGHAIIRSFDIAKRFRSLGKTVVLGGYMVSLMPEEAKKYCNSVVIGDAEKVWPRLISDYENGCMSPNYKDPIDTLITPLPRFDLIINKRIGDFLPVQAARGCPNHCNFCSVSCLYKGKYIKSSIDQVIRDISYVKSLGFKKFLLLDDNIAADKKYLTELCTEIKNLNMQWLSQCSIEIGKNNELLATIAGSGCISLSFGLESISAESLSSLNKEWADPRTYRSLLKNIQDVGIDLSTEMVVGADGDTIESIKKTAAFIEQCKIVVPRFYILTPIPGTLFYDQMLQEKRICNEDIYSYNGSEAVHIPKNMTPVELTKAYWNLYNEVYSFGSILRRIIWCRRFLRHPVRHLFYLFINLYYRYQIKHKITPNII